jgi:hypothetical protein
MSRGFRGHASEAPRLALSPTLPGLRTFLNSVPGMIDIDRCIFHFVLGLGQAVDGDIVEIGSWQGRNTVALATVELAHKLVKSFGRIPCDRDISPGG